MKNQNKAGEASIKTLGSVATNLAGKENALLSEVEKVSLFRRQNYPSKFRVSINNVASTKQLSCSR